MKKFFQKNQRKKNRKPGRYVFKYVIKEKRVTDFNFVTLSFSSSERET